MNILSDFDKISPLPDLVIWPKNTLPIVQWWMGVWVSTWQLAGAVAREGAIGTLSSVGHSVTPAYKPVFIERIATKKSELGRPLSEEEFNQIFFDTNLYCITQEVTRAKTISMGNGAIWMNVMKATNDYDRQVLAACEAGVDGIVSWAGLPLNLPDITKEYSNVSLIPILSNLRGVQLLIKKWIKYGRLPDAIVLEDPSRAAGHLGSSSTKTVDDESTTLEVSVPQTVAFLKANNYNIPVIAAGGIVDRADIDRVLSLGASGVQMGTRFLATDESGASADFKQHIIDATPGDIKTYVSNAMLPARAIATSGIFTIIEWRAVYTRKCVENCLVQCAYRDGVGTLRNTWEDPAQMCILNALVAATDWGAPRAKKWALYFTGTWATRIDTLKSVQQIMAELTGQ